MCILFIQDGWTALIITAYHGHDECMKLLLSKGANIDLVTNVCIKYGVSMRLRRRDTVIKGVLTQFCYIDLNNVTRYSMVNAEKLNLWYLIFLPTVLSYSVFQDGDTALSWAARFDKIKCLRLLLEHGADMNMCNNVCNVNIGDVEYRCVIGSIDKEYWCGLSKQFYFYLFSFFVLPSAECPVYVLIYSHHYITDICVFMGLSYK